MTTRPNPASESVRQAAGDGALLRSAIELATLTRYHMAALVVVCDNAGYDSERPMLDGPYPKGSNPIDPAVVQACCGGAARGELQVSLPFGRPTVAWAIR